MANKQLGNTLRTLRSQLGYTQQHVADLLGLKNKSTFASWEGGVSEPDIYTFLRLCKIYGIEDIYGTFDQSAPVPPTPCLPLKTAEKYVQLGDKPRKIVDSLIEQLLDLQS